MHDYRIACAIGYQRQHQLSESIFPEVDKARTGADFLYSGRKLHRLHLRIVGRFIFGQAVGGAKSLHIGPFTFPFGVRHRFYPPEIGFTRFQCFTGITDCYGPVALDHPAVPQITSPESGIFMVVSHDHAVSGLSRSSGFTGYDPGKGGMRRTDGGILQRFDRLIELPDRKVRCISVLPCLPGMLDQISHQPRRFFFNSLQTKSRKGKGG